MSGGDPGAVAVIVAARNEEVRVGAAVRGARCLPGVDLVVVVDDASSDGTARAAADAGARALRHARGRGKGAAMETGAEGVRRIERRESAGGSGAPPRLLLFLDADLGGSAARAGPLIDPVRSGNADMSIALFPATRTRLGGHGSVVRLARDGIRRATGWEPEQPLNGQRCVTRAAFESVLPLASGFGAETGLTIDALRRGLRLVEIEVALAHRPTGAGVRAQAHRVRQLVDVAGALAARAVQRHRPGKHEEYPTADAS